MQGMWGTIYSDLWGICFWYAYAGNKAFKMPEMRQEDMVQEGFVKEWHMNGF